MAAGAERPSGEAPRPEHLVVGHVSKAHGTKGELLIWTLTDRPEEVFEPGRVLIAGDESGGVGTSPLELVVETSRPYRKGMLVGFEGYPDRNAAEALRGRYLLIDASEAETGEGEVYYHDLLGLRVETVDGVEVGVVREVYETEPAHLLEVKGADKVHLVPFAERLVVELDLEARRLVIDPPEGLLGL